jgi:pimeloyl-ACP methyl ester carboxylesterase
MVDQHFIEVNGVHVAYHDEGKGPVLVMLHGSGPGATGWSNYSRNVPELARHFRVICPDLPGFGASDVKPVTGAIPGFWAETIIALLDALGIAKAHFVGNSMGGMITLKIALEHPERIARMVLMGPGGGFPVTAQWPSPGIVNLVTFYEGDGPTLEKVRFFIEQAVFDRSVITPELLAERLEAALDPRIAAQPPMRPGPAGPPEELWRDPRLARLPHEVLILWGREDRILPLDTGFTFMKQIPRARLLVMPQCGHWVQWEHAQEFNEQVALFLQAATHDKGDA